MDLTNLDVPLLEKAVAWVQEQEALPEEQREWNQADYVAEMSCGMAYCVAGYVGQLLEPGYATNSVHNGVHVSRFACAQLGIPTDEPASSQSFDDSAVYDALRMFNDDNDAAAVRAVADTYIARAREQGVQV